MMKQVFFGVLAVAMLAGPAAAQQKEPSFQGRSLKALIADLKSPSPETRNAAAYSISGIGPAAAPAVPALIQALSDPAASVRYPVCVALREIGPAAIAAEPALKKATDDPSEDVAFMARKALESIHGLRPAYQASAR
ncbi:MAG TPA: HEAT repeat domain-containing protein [Gemmatimonadales bacterium]|nr:HEAT repeat domain-containing protein [Gemmatimonadales bacterium]